MRKKKKKKKTSSFIFFFFFLWMASLYQPVANTYVGDTFTFRPGQMESLESLGAGQDTIALLSTGTGKSIIYQLFVLAARERDPTVCGIVVTPLISLMEDQVHKINHAWGLDRLSQRIRRRRDGDAPIATMLGSAQSDVGAAQGAFTFFFLSPEKLATCHQWLSSRTVALVVVDEAHCLSEHGHDFRPEYRQIAAIRAHLPLDTVFLALTATADPHCIADICSSLRLRPGARLVRGSMNRRNIHYAVRRKQGLVKDMRCIAAAMTPEAGSVFVYVPTRKETERVAQSLREVSGLSDVAPYHAGMDTGRRAVILRSFAAGTIRVLVSTSAAGLGLDIGTVRMVIHYGMPKTVAAFLQESGRAGRRGDQAWSILFAGPGDYATQKVLALRVQNLVHQQRLLKYLSRMYQYTHRDGCRRQYLMKEMGDQSSLAGSPRCCDVCDGVTVVPVPAAGHPAFFMHIVSLLAQQPRGLGTQQLIATLKGERTVATRRFMASEMFGRCRSVPKTRMRECIHTLLEGGIIETFLAQSIPLIRITQRGTEYLEEKATPTVDLDWDKFRCKKKNCLVDP